jgi:uncharacterized membrane protein
MGESTYGSGPAAGFPHTTGADTGIGQPGAAEAVPPEAETGVGPGRIDPRAWVGPEGTPRLGVRTAPVPSLAAIAGHPLHPAVVPLPIGALALAAVSDIAYARSGDTSWARTSRFLIGAGVASGAVAAALGATDFLGRPAIRRRPEAWFHAGGNVMAMGLSIANLALRARDARHAVVPAGLALSVATGTMLLVTGWLGGELSYRHRIGVTPD